jgi:hypothetical protein
MLRSMVLVQPTYFVKVTAGIYSDVAKAADVLQDDIT